MKLQRRTFRVFWDVHAWAGVISALLLYLMFFAAAFALFHPELNDWAEPRSNAAAHEPPSLQPLLVQLVREQRARAPTHIGFWRHDSALMADLRGSEGERQFRYASDRKQLEPLRSNLGSFLYELHYLGPIPYGIYLAGLAAMAMCLALVTGVLIHLKDLVRQWFQFRPRCATRTWASDMHKLLGIFGLPFQLFYAWSGAVLCLAYVAVQPAFTATVFRGDQTAALATRGYTEAPAPTGKHSSRLVDLDALLVRARALLPGLEPEYVALENPFDEASVVQIYGTQSQFTFGNAALTLRASDGQLLHASSFASASALQRFEAWFYGLHYAEFGGYGVKWVYALLALATCAVIGTGNLVWLERRDRARAQLGNRVLSRLTVGVVSGVPLAVATLFVANRSLPAALLNRTTVEQAVFWIALAVALLCPFLVRSDRRVAGRQLALAGALFALALFVDLLTRQPLLADAVQRGVASALLLLAALCLAAGIRLLRPSSRAAPRSPECDARTLASAGE